MDAELEAWWSFAKDMSKTYGYRFADWQCAKRYDLKTLADQFGGAPDEAEVCGAQPKDKQ